MHESSRYSAEGMSETFHLNKVPHGSSILAGPPPSSGASGFAWAKRRKPEASSILSDGSKSRISALDPIFAKGTYDLTKRVVDVAERRYRTSISHQAHHVGQRHVDSSERRSNSSMTFDSTERPDGVTYNRVNLKPNNS